MCMIVSLQTACESRNILDDATCPSMGLQLGLAPGTIASIRVHSMKALYIGAQPTIIPQTASWAEELEA